MVAVKEITWEEASAPGFEQTTRQAWREAVAETAERAKQTLPECHGRVDKAVAIVLHGDVELLADGKAKIASQSNGAPTPRRRQQLQGFQGSIQMGLRCPFLLDIRHVLADAGLKGFHIHEGIIKRGGKAFGQPLHEEPFETLV
jgi:hypothetical protein